MPTLSLERWQQISPYLDEVLALPEAERTAWVESFRVEKPELADLLQELLQEHLALAQKGFLEGQAIGIRNESSLAGQTVGVYRLLSPIGEGGMGSVWLAERSDGRFERQVAVKFLRFAIASHGGAERFKREGRILGQLADPHIAELIDAGVTPNGEPYLVLEHVGGEQIDEYCDRRKLDVEARIRLFLDVLSAVAQAHANLIVHRDLKPSNVLVRNDGQVKLLDFGIAKLLTEDVNSAPVTQLTREGGALTPQFAAPEQVSGEAITTATDVYALGVLLYLLLTGQHPAGAGPHSPADLVKAIVEMETPRASDVVMAAEARTAAEKRGTTPERLRRELRGDLDTIVGKALKKNPAERYPSVTALGADLQRYLRHEPIIARPDTIMYRTGKFVRRNRMVVALVTLALVSVIAGATAALVQARTARRQRDLAIRERDRASRVVDFMSDMFAAPDPNEARGAKITAREILDKASKQIDTSLAQDPGLRAQMMSVMGKTYFQLGVFSAGQTLLEHAIELGRQTNGPGDQDVLSSTNDLAMLLIQKGQLATAKKLLQEALDNGQRILGPENPVVLDTKSQVAYALILEGHNLEALELAKNTFETRRRVEGESAIGTLRSMNVLAIALGRIDRLEESAGLYQEELDIERRVHGSDSQEALNAMSNLGATLIMMGRLTEGQLLLQQTLEIQRRVDGPQDPETARTLYNLACVAARQRHFDNAFSFLRQSIPFVYIRTLMGIEKETDLNSLHNDPRWRSIVTTAKQRVTAAQKSS
jgi:eukaryotic-like serine/threonine-protein kinase